MIALIVLFSVTAYAAQVILGQGGSAPATTATASAVFTRNLSEGSSGADVWALNQILDVEFNTTIASPAVFGASTESYLAKLEQRYTLAQNSGVSDAATIAKLNALAQEYNITLAEYALAFPPTPAAALPKQVFTQTLSLGMVSSDVVLLKTILNSDPATALVYTSAAEAADPADLFDAATQAAVIKFQDKYASEILAPSGLTQGTGVAGPATLAKLNEILAGFSASTGAQSGSQSVAPTLTTGANPNLNTTQNDYGIGTSGTPCTTNLYNCGAWGACSASGVQTRTCTETFACGNQTNAVAPTTQSCTPPPVVIPAGTIVGKGFILYCGSTLDPAPGGTTKYAKPSKCIVSSGSLICSGAIQSCQPGTVCSATPSCPAGSTLTSAGSPSYPSQDSSCNGNHDQFGAPTNITIDYPYTCVEGGSAAAPTSGGDIFSAIGNALGSFFGSIF